MKQLGNYNKFLIIVVFLVQIVFQDSVFAQYKKVTRNDRLYKAKSFNQVQSAIMKANRYESVSEFGKSYNLYKNLIRTNYKEPKVLNGYVRNSVKTKKIKECELKLKALISGFKLGNKNYDIKTEMQLKSFLGQLFLMTGREMQGNEIIKIVNHSNISSKLKYSINGRMYYESLSYKNAIEQFLQARKELKDNNLFSKELFNSYRSGNMVLEAANELINIFLKEDNKLNKTKRFDLFSAKHEMIKLFEIEENRDTVLGVVIDRSEKDDNLINLLSELYFMNKDYENSYLVLKKISNDENELPKAISFATKLLKEKDYKNSANFYSLFFTENKKIQKKELKQYFLYIDTLVKLGQLEKSIEKLSNIDFPEAKIKLAYIYHLSGNWKRSKKIYEKQFEILKTSPNEFIDYLKLLISLKDYSRSMELAKKAMTGREFNLIRSKVYDQLIYLDTLLSLMKRDEEEFSKKYKILTEDLIISDSDNDLIKIKNNLGIIDNDEILLNSYLDYLSYQVDKTNQYEVAPIQANSIENKAKKLFVLKLNYYYLKASKNKDAQSVLIKSILGENPADSETGALVLDYCENNSMDREETNEILMELLKGDFSDLIKSKARKIIRQK